MNGLDGLLSDPLLAMGVGLLGGNRGLTKGAAFGNAMQGGLLSAQNAQQMQAMSMLRQAQVQKLQREQEQQAQLEQYIGQLPPEEQALARIAPEQYVGGVIKASMPQEQPSEARMAQLAYPGLPLPQAILKYRESGRASTNISLTNPIYNIPKPDFGYQYVNPLRPQEGVTVVPGGPADPSRISQTEAAKLREDLRAAESYRDTAQKYKEDLASGGPALPGESWVSGRPGRLQLQKGEIISFIGKLRDLGVLQPSDVKLINDALTDPASFKANVQYRVGGVKTLTDPLDYLMYKLDTFIGARKPGATGETTSAEPGGRPRGGVSAEGDYRPALVIPPGTKAPSGPWEKY